MKLVPVFLIAAAFIPVADAQHISVGIAAGFPLTDGMSDFSSVANQITTHDYSNSKLYILGPMIEVRLPLSLAIEVNALYRPLNLTIDSQTGLGPIIRTSHDYSSWEFPVLGKYRLPLLPVVKPFVEAGPSFRAKGSSLSYLSGRGFSLGGGIEVKILRLRIAPVLRYTHWGSDSTVTGIICTGPCVTIPTTAPASNQNQAEFLVGLSF